jgi:hypothetical protein
MSFRIPNGMNPYNKAEIARKNKYCSVRATGRAHPVADLSVERATQMATAGVTMTARKSAAVLPGIIIVSMLCWLLSNQNAQTGYEATGCEENNIKPHETNNCE